MNRRRGTRRSGAGSAWCVAVMAALVLSACQVQISTDISVAENGSGTVTVAVAADGETLRAAPELVDSLQLGDLEEAGWSTTVQNPTADGGATVTLVHEFSSPDEATGLLTELSGTSGPLRDVVLVRTGTTNNSTFALTGTAGLPDGTSGFADSEALVALGGAPFMTTLESRDVGLADTLAIAVQLTLPGEPVNTNGETTPRAADDLVSTFRWQVPVDGSEISLAATTRNRDVSAMIATWIARGVFAIMILAAALALIYVATVVSRRTRSTPSS